MKLSHILFIICLLALTLGLLDVGNAMSAGFLRALGGIFFILTFVVRVVEKAEAEDEAINRTSQPVRPEKSSNIVHPSLKAARSAS